MDRTNCTRINCTHKMDGTNCIPPIPLPKMDGTNCRHANSNKLDVLRSANQRGLVEMSVPKKSRVRNSFVTLPTRAVGLACPSVCPRFVIRKIKNRRILRPKASRLRFFCASCLAPSFLRRAGHVFERTRWMSAQGGWHQLRHPQDGWHQLGFANCGWVVNLRVGLAFK